MTLLMPRGGCRVFIGICLLLCADAYAQNLDNRMIAERELPPELRAKSAELKRYMSVALQSIKAGNLSKAIEAQEKLASLVRETVGPTNEALAGMLEALAKLHELRADFTAARKARQEMVAILARLHGENHWKSTEARFALDDLSRLEKLSPQDRQTLRESDRLSATVSDLLKQGKRSDAVSAVLQVTGIRSRLLGLGHPRLADVLCQAAKIYTSDGGVARAAALYKKAAEIYRESFGEDHPRCTEAKTRLAGLARAARARSETKPPLGLPSARNSTRSDERSRAERQPAGRGGLATPTPGKLTMAQALRLAAMIPNLKRIERLLNQGEFEQAADVAQKVLDIVRDAFEPEHPQYILALEAVAKAQMATGDATAARKSWQELLSLRERLYGPQHWKANDARWTLRDLDRLEDAGVPHGDAEQLREARRLRGVAIMLFRQGQFKSALETATRALAILEQMDRESVAYIGNLNDLAVVFAQLGDFERAVGLGRKAVALAVQKLGHEHPTSARALGNLGSFYLELGKYVEAEPLCRRFADVTKKSLGPDHPQYAVGLARLGSLYESMGDYARAEPLYCDALEVDKANSAEDPISYARRLDSLAGLYVTMNELERAKALYVESMGIVLKQLGEQHPQFAAALHNMGQLYAASGEPSRALPLFLRASELVRKVFGDQHPTYGRILIDRAGAHAALGEYDRAEDLFRQALDCLGESNRIALSGLGGVYFAAGKYQDAERCFRKNLEIARRDLELASLIQSERQQRAMLARARDYLDVYLSVAFRAGASADETYRPLLGWKGAVFERQRRLLLARDDPRSQRIHAQLQEIASRLAAAALAAPQAESRDAWERDVADLTDKKERLEAELVPLTSGVHDGREREEIDAEAIRLRLPPNSALLDFLEYSRYEPPRRQQGRMEVTRHLVVFILRRDRPVVRVDLGPTEPIEQAVKTWRLRELPQTAGRGPGERERELAVRRPSQPQPEDTLRTLVWEPVKKHLDRADLVLVSPDGALTRFPLAALPGKAAGSYLIEDLSIAVIPVPRLLPQLLDELAVTRAGDTAHEPSWLLVGDVDFGAAPASTLTASADKRGTEPDTSREAAGKPRRPAARGGSLQWSPLPGTAQEIDSLEQLWRSIHPDARAKTLRGEAPTEEAIRRLAPQFRFVHLATHGFFAPPEMSSAWKSTVHWLHTLPGRTVEVGPFGRSGLAGWHPGLLSGVALAGANRGMAVSGESQSVNDDGILTALEVATLDMRRNDLVVLSACETGLGRQAGGEGLLGLQRAFQVAGSKTVVASLWKVDDQSTRQLMSHFYTNLWQKRLSKIEALRRAQLAILQGGTANSSYRGPGAERPVRGSSPARRASPGLWAAWVLSGAPGDLRF